jgi:CheY-like chemotaxis protein
VIRTAMTAEPTAIAIAPEGATGTLLVLIERLTASGIRVDVVDDVGSAADLARHTPAAPPCILLDLRSLTAGTDPEDAKIATERIRRTVHGIPYVKPVAITSQADVPLVLACIRAGAGDVIDLRLEGTATARAVVYRVYQRQLERAGDARAAAELRSMIEDLLKDLIRTERRSIDLEEKLAHFESVTGEVQHVGDTRPPAILIVESERPIADELADRLEDAGVATFAYLSGEEAVRELETLATASTGFDLALVAAQLPGIDGLATVRRLRAQIPGLPAFLMTAVHDADLAARAADLGVVGFVQKPLPALDQVVERLAQLAREALQRTREHVYLQRIKARHDRVLARYRALPREP